MTRNKRLPTAEQLRALLEVWQEIEAAQQAADESGEATSRMVEAGGVVVTVFPTRYRTIGPDGLDEPGDFCPEPQETS